MTDEEVIKLRQEGYSLQNIGNLFGVSRQAVFCRLGKYPKIEPYLTWEKEASRKIGCSHTYLASLRKERVVTPKRTGEHWTYSLEDINLVQLSMQRNCLHCRTAFTHSNRAKYCPKCRTESRRYGYPFLSPEGKKRANQASRSWLAQHPEKVREYNRRTQEKLKAKVLA